MDGFRLFDEQHTTSEPLCRAYKAVERIAPEKAEPFLYALRRATIVETRPTTHWDELLRVAQLCGIDGEVFRRAYESRKVHEALLSDMQEMALLGIRQLSVCLLEHNDKRLLFNPLMGYDQFINAINRIYENDI